MHESDLAGIHGVSQIFTSIHLPARSAPLGPLTAPLAPQLNIILPFTAKSSQRSPSFIFPYQNSLYISLFPIAVTCLRLCDIY